MPVKANFYIIFLHEGAVLEAVLHTIFFEALCALIKFVQIQDIVVSFQAKACCNQSLIINSVYITPCSVQV